MEIGHINYFKGGYTVKFLCIDFETANRFNGSACAVGIACFDGIEVIGSKHWLIKPHSEHSFFDPFYTLVHGITETHVEKAPEFPVIYEILKPYFNGRLLAAHNAAYDMSVLRHSLDLYGIPYPEIEYICSYKVASKVWRGLDNYKLNTVCRYIQHKFIRHHPEEDAVACGRVLLAAITETQVQTTSDLSKNVGMRIGKLFPGGYTPCSIRKKRQHNPDWVNLNNVIADVDEFDDSHPFYEKNIVFTGTLRSLTRLAAAKEVKNVGGSVQNNVTKTTNFLIMGNQDYSLFTDGKQSNKTKKARVYIKQGQPIQIIDETEFLEMLRS